MSGVTPNINVTGNEAQFNEKVTFLKDIEIKGTLLIPDQELTLSKLTVPLISGAPELIISGETTFLDKVNFQEELSFPLLEIRDKLDVGIGGTVLTANSLLNPGKVGIGSTQPTELLDVFGKAKILDLELRNLLVTGISTFKGDVQFHGNSGVTSVFFDKSHNRLKFIDESKATFGTGNDLEISHTISLKDQTDSNGDSVVDGRTSLIEESGSGGLIFKSNGGDGPGAYQFFDQNWQPLLKLHGGNNARAILFHNGIEKFKTTGIGVSVLGDLIVPDVGIRTSVVGLGTTLPANPEVITELNDATQGPLRLDITGSISVGRNLYDSSGSHGEAGMFLKRNVYGVRWVAITPDETQQGILVMDEGVEIPTTGIAQTFHTLNFVQGNSLGIGSDTLIPTAQNIPGTGIASITTFDLWGYNGSGSNVDIYRMTKVGIGTTQPNEIFQVGINSQSAVITGVGSVGIGTTRPSHDLTVVNGTLLNNLRVTGLSTFVGITTQESTLFTNELSSIGISTFFNTTDSSEGEPEEGAVQIKGGLGVVKNLNVGAKLEVDNDTQLNQKLNVENEATFQHNIILNADDKFFIIEREDGDDKFTIESATGDAHGRGTLDIDGAANFNLTDDATSSTSGGSVTIDGGASVAKKLFVGNNFDVGTAGVSNFNNTSQASSSTSGGSVTIDGGTGIAKKLFVGGDTKIESVTDATGASNAAALQVVGGAAIGRDLFVGIDLDVKGNTQLGDANTDTLTVDATSTFKANILAEKNLDVDGHTELDNLNVTGVSTFGPGITTQKSRLFANHLEVVGLSTFIGITTQQSTLFTNQSSAIGVATFKNTIDVDSNIKDQNDDTGTSVAESLSGNITGAIYNSTTGVMVLTIANHGFENGDSIKIPDGTIKLSCTYKGSTIEQSYPRSKDPNSGKWLVISNKTTNTFEVNVGDGGLAAGVAHSFVSATGGVIHSSGQYIKDDYRLASVGTGVSWRPSGVQTKRTIWVSKSGSDTNSGLLEGDAKATIGAAAAIAVETDTIKVRPGVYEENNPIGLRTDVSVTGEDLRLCIIKPKNKNKDVFHVRRGCLIENLNFGGSNVGVGYDGSACVAFPPPAGSESAVTGYTAPGPANEGPSGRWRSPYVRNCTNFMTSSIGMKIDGNNANGAFTGINSVGADLKSMVCDSFTQYNENGIGVSLTNNGYAQLVSIFTINTDIAIYASTGAQCDLTNSNSSFGNFGLVAVGLGSTQYTGIVSNTNTAGEIIGNTNPEQQDTVVAVGVTDIDNNVRRAFDGQALYFKIDLDNYPDTPAGLGRITSPLERLSSVKLRNVDLSGFSPIDPPSVLLIDADDNTLEPKGPQGIIAEATATVSPAGVLTEINVVAQGRNYLASQNLVIDVEGDRTLADAIMEPIYFTVDTATEPTPSPAGISTITFNEFIPYELFPDDPFALQRISRILTSSHSFEYVGTGTDINIATPLQGAIPIKANEVVATGGAQIPFTSTDQKGNFDIGEGLQINQTTSTISGRDFSRSIQAEVTPLILALR